MSLCILVLGYIVRGPLGGYGWHHTQYLLGLKQLGHDVYFLEDSGDFPNCYHPERDLMSNDPTYGLRFASHQFEYLGLAEHWAYYDAHTSQWMGPAKSRIAHICRQAELLINVSGINPMRPWFEQIPVRVFIDTDPAFIQIRNLTDPAHRAETLKHNRFFSFGENIGRGALVPEDGFCWKPTRQPVVMDAWPVADPAETGGFSTIMQWDSYRSVEYAGRRYGMKSEAFRPFVNLPQYSKEKFQLALGAPQDVRHSLAENGWQVLDARVPSQTPQEYQNFIGRSKAEFAIAKHGYVVSRSGWFSERATCYLAMGRPAVLQDTGFSAWLETGRGVLAFSNAAEALSGVEEVSRNYHKHCRWARELVASEFDARIVLSALINESMSSGKDRLEPSMISI